MVVEGEISKSMGVETKPAHKLEIGGYWVLVDPKMPQPMIDRLKMAVMIHDVEIEKNDNIRTI